MNIVCIIPARAGSKRIPKKNIKDFLGKPIIAYSIEAALASEVFDDIIVSTDDEEIARVSKAYGAKVPFMRSAETSDDHATLIDAVIEATIAYKALGHVVDYVCCIFATAPFIQAKDLQGATQTLIDHPEYDSCRFVTEFDFPPQRGLIQQGDYLNFREPDHAYTRSQELVPMYHDAGQCRIIKTDILLDKKTVFTDRMMPVRIPRTHVQDIDTVEDWQVAEIKYRILYG